MQGVEVGDALDVEHADFTVDDELALLDLQRRFDDPGKAPGLVQPAPGEQFDVLPVTDDTPAIAVVFYFVDPVGAARDLRRNRLAIIKFDHGRLYGPLARTRVLAGRDGAALRVKLAVLL